MSRSTCALCGGAIGWEPFVGAWLHADESIGHDGEPVEKHRATKASAIAFREGWLREIEGRRWHSEMESHADYVSGRRQERAHVNAQLEALRALPDDADDAAVRRACP